MKLKFLILMITLLAMACAPATSAAPIDETEVRVDSIDLLILESFPVQVRAQLQGTTRSGCLVIDAVNATREGETFEISFTTSQLENARCTDERQPFEQSVALDVLGLPAGTYTVRAGDVSETFELSVDNVLQEAPAGTEVFVDSLGAFIDSSTPKQVNVLVSGNVANSCVRLDDILAERIDDTFTLTAIASREGEICTEALMPFEHTVTIDIEGVQPGTYSVSMDNAETTFEVP